jgi:hypothetical protein
MADESKLSNEAKAIIASNLVGTVALLRANRWDEGHAKTYALKLYEDLRAALDD